MNGKKVKKLRKQYRQEFGRSPVKSGIAKGVSLAGSSNQPIVHYQVDEFRQYKKKNK